jgi:hypothetical protein
MSSFQIEVKISGLPLTKSEDVRHHVRSHCCGMTIVSWKETRNLSEVIALLKFPTETNLYSSLERLKRCRFQGHALRISTGTPNATALQSDFTLVISCLPQNLNSDQLKHHIPSHTGGALLSLEIGRSNSGGKKATCRVRSHIPFNQAVARLRQAKFQGRNLDVEILYRRELSQVDESSMNGATPSPPRSRAVLSAGSPTSNFSHGNIAFSISNLPSVDESRLKHHIRSHAGGKVLSLDYINSSRGGMQAVCVVKTRVHAGSALARLESARFQGKKLHIQLLTEQSMSTLPAQQVPPQEGSAAAVEAAHLDTFGLSTRIPTRPSLSQPPSQDRDIAAQAAARNRLDLVQCISTRFCHFVTSDPGRLYRVDDENEIDNMFVEYCMDRLSGTPNFRGEEQDDDSRAWVQRPPTVSPSTSAPLTMSAASCLVAAQTGNSETSSRMQEPAIYEPWAETQAPTLVDASIQFDGLSVTPSLVSTGEGLAISQMSFENVGRRLANDDLDWSVLY